jgi:hypothetical protein
VIANQQIAQLLQGRYSLQQITEITAFLQRMGTLDFPALPNGLFPAAVLKEDKRYTGYSYIWVRDNVHIAHAHAVAGNDSVAVKNVSALMAYFLRHKKRFEDIISGKADPAEPMNRPRVRFNGETLSEIPEKWGYAQNDALGYFLWLCSRLFNEGKLPPSRDSLEMLTLFAQYFQAIEYWRDEDSGHWEEVRKISASSIGTVIAGLREFKGVLNRFAGKFPAREKIAQLVESLLEVGQSSLNAILPAECRQPDPLRYRPYDAALLFLVYPLRVVEGRMADRILENTRVHLQGECGIRRYIGDSYWAPDYKKKLSPKLRTADFSDDLSSRNRLLETKGTEAQWCIFDPIVSCIYGTRFLASETGKDLAEENLARQTQYLNRSLGQITAEDSADVFPFRCPELYYLEDGRYVPNDHVPLLWTQANLMLGLSLMRRSCGLAEQHESKEPSASARG